MQQKVAFLGLGVMGFPIARHLAKAGHAVTVYNRTRSKAEAWIAAQGGQLADTPAAAAQQAEVIFSCVGNDDDLRQVTLGTDGAFQGMRPGSLYVDHTTTSALVARELSLAAQERGLAFIDAPVSGGQVGAEQGILTVMVGGEAADVARATPLIRHYARAVTHLGPAGSGQLTKMVNQICGAGVIQGLAEGLHFAQCAGLDPSLVLETISKGAAQSWQMEHRGPTMIAGRFDFGFAVDWMRKDMAIALDESRRNGAQLAMTALIDQFFAEVQALGGGRLDTSSLLLRLKNQLPHR